MIKVIYTDSLGRETDVTYARDISFEIGGCARPEVIAALTEWAKQRQRVFNLIDRPQSILGRMLRDGE